MNYLTEEYMDEVTLAHQKEVTETMNNCVASYGVTRRIVCAACLHTGALIIGVRHWCPIMHMTAKKMGITKNSELLSKFSYVEGFIDQYGVFVDRVEAMQIVLASGQPFFAERNGGSGKELYSEGIC